MELRITPLSHFATYNKTKAKNNNSIFSTVKPTTNKKLLIISRTKIEQPSINKPQPSIKLSSNIFQTININNDRKGILLYQQTERDNSFSNRAELVNRFNFKI